MRRITFMLLAFPLAFTNSFWIYTLEIGMPPGDELFNSQINPPYVF